MTERSARTMGIDYGEKRIGIAVSDPMGIIAQALTTISYKNFSEAIAEIKAIISDYQITEVVLGYPLTLSGEEGTAARKVRGFLGELEKESKLPIAIMDERFTSKIARDTVKSAGKSPSKNKAKLDQISAAVILQSYLDRKTNRASQAPS